jgi:hypothetical protein
LGEKVKSTDDLLEKGFQLAYFILPDRSQAVRILSSAVNKLKAQRGRESRRAYWRDKYLKRAITRITREDSDMLQWLVFYESDPYEKEQEAYRQATLTDMVLRYVKSLVRMTSAMSSFHVGVGLQRLLHNYSTTETQQVYESITDRYPGSDEYRRAKAILMNKLEERFGAMLKTCRTQYGEKRFESCDQQARWIDLVDLCLKAFTPWSTFGACPVPVNYGGPERKLPADLSGEGAGDADQNRIETNRCHAFIDPDCYGRLVHALSLEAPSHKLDIPRFYMENPESQNHSDEPHQAPRLSVEERLAIIEHASSQAERRHKTVPGNLVVVVDGKERVQFAASATAARQFDIDEGAELMEIWTTNEESPLLLATHRIAYTPAKGIETADLRFAFKGGTELRVHISGSQEAAEGTRKAIVWLSCLARAQAVAGLPNWLRAAPKIALASAAFIALGWFLATTTHRQPASKKYSENVQSQPSAITAPVELAKAHEIPLTYRLISDDLATRGNGAPEMPSIVVPPRPALIQLEIPISSADASRSFHAALKPFLRDEEIVVENGLKAHRTSTGAVIVTFELTSTFLEPNKDYLVDLRYRTDKGRLVEVSSYTFHAERGKK